MNMRVRVAGLEFEYPWLNASGIFSFPTILKRLESFRIGGLVTKSITHEPRRGFREPIVAEVGNCSLINAVGLSNPGFKEMKRELEEIGNFKRPLILSVIGKEEEIAEIVSELEELVDGFELNLSCPNISPGEKFGMVVGMDEELTFSYVSAVRDSTKKPILVKLTPNTDKVVEIGKAAEEGGADALVAINTVFPSLALDPEGNPILTNVHGGLSGKAIKPIGLSIVRSLSEEVEIPVIGVGGISGWKDVLDYFYSGARCVEIGTAFARKSTPEVGSFLDELYKSIANFLNSLGYRSVEEFFHELREG